MPFCSKCGFVVADGVAFCQKCGTPIGATAGGPIATPVAVAPAASGLSENVASLLCYVVGWITGIIFLIIDKRPAVRFHAAQSIVVFGVLHVLRLILTFGFLGTWHYGYGAIGFWSLWGLVSLALTAVTLILWIVLMVTAFQGKRVEIPVAAGIAKSFAGSGQ